jgi:tRNA uridine 5-carboxymethylaminomethyl modification enzyme
LDVDEIYVNGLSMSLPAETQQAIVTALPGLSNAKMIRPGYAVEYDFVQPTELRHTLECKQIRGLFLAGQINGTSGYEEAAAQGLLAGLNAGLASLDQPSFELRRDESYIGVLVDDLVTRGCLEPYRMFTSRAEHRLLLRIDNADLRLTPYARRLGLVDDRRWGRFERRRLRYEANLLRLGAAIDAGNGVRMAAVQALRRPEVRLEALIKDGLELDVETELDVVSLETAVKYEGYLKQEASRAERLQRSERRRIPAGFPFGHVPGLSAEVVQRLSQIAPETLGQASRIPGVTPAAVAVLNAYLSRLTATPA